MMSDKIRQMAVRAVTGVIFVTAVVVCFLRPEAMILLFAIVTGLTMWEFTGLVNDIGGACVNRAITTTAGVYLFIAVAGYCSGITPSAVFVPYLLTIVYLLVSELYTKNADPIRCWAMTALSQMYVALPLSMVNVLAFRDTAEGTAYILLVPLSVFIFLWVGDTGAYCVGSLFGRHKLFPRVSPAKTWEGSVGGAILAIAAAVVIALTRSGSAVMPLWQWIGLSVVVILFGMWGDLVESLFKRSLGIKDSGSILPGHGGMLDRFDSSLIALPAAVVYLYTLSVF